MPAPDDDEVGNLDADTVLSDGAFELEPAPADTVLERVPPASAPLRASAPAPLRASAPAPLRASAPAPLRASARAAPASAPAAPPGEVAAAPRTNAPAPLARGEVAPAFRSDLELTRTPSGYRVRDPRTNESSTLNDAEVSLARMLDGRRSIAEVVARAATLDIPINLESLQAFLVQLETRGLLTSSAAPQVPSMAWPARARWETGVRHLFQSGIRLLRAGKPDEAAAYFEALLAQDPENIEARELLAMTQTPVPVPVAPSFIAPYPPAVASDPLPPPYSEMVAPAAPYTGNVALPYAGNVVAPPYPGNAAPYPVAPQYSANVVASAAPYPVAPPYVAPAAPYPATAPITEPIPSLRPHRRAAQIGLVALACIALFVGGILIMKGRGSTTDAVAETKPTEPPVKVVAPVKPEPARTERPVVKEPVKTTEPPVVKEPVKTTEPPVKVAEPPPVDPPVQVTSPIAGEIGRVFVDRARAVKQGEKLFEVVYMTGNAAKVRELNARIAALTKIANQDTGGAFVPASVIQATNDLARAHQELRQYALKVQRVAVTASQAGDFAPRVSRGATVKRGAVLGEIVPAR